MNDKQAKYCEILEQESFLQAMRSANTRQDVQNAFAEHGLEMSREEVDAFLMVASNESGSPDELDAQALEDVSGGSAAGVTALWVLSTSAKIAAGIGKACWNAGKWVANKGW